MAANGRLPDSALVDVAGCPGARLTPATAASWAAIRVEVHALYGWTPELAGPLDAYRPLSGGYYCQHETFLRRYVRRNTGSGDRRYYDSDGNGVREAFWRLIGQAAAAVPGTSNHGLGTTADVANLGGFSGKRYGQFAAVAIRNGWSNAEGRRVAEAWHWSNISATAVGNVIATPGAVASAPATAAPAPLIPTVQEDDMLIIESPGALWTLTGDHLTGIADIAQANRLTDKGIARVVYTAPEFKALRETTAGRELIVNNKAGYAVGILGGRYIPLGDIAEVQVHQAAGCRQRQVTEQTFRNLTA